MTCMFFRLMFWLNSGGISLTTLVTFRKLTILVPQMKEYCVAIRLLAHTQPKLYRLREKKTQMMEAQINGGAISEKVNIDVTGVTRSHGFNGKFLMVSVQVTLFK